MAERRAVVVGIWGCIGIVAVSFAVVYSRHQIRRRRRSWFAEAQDMKPQKKFRFVLADNSKSPFAHLQTQENGGSECLHPYSERIQGLLSNPPLSSLSICPTVPPDMEGPHVWVETQDQLEALAQDLSQQSEFGVDTEQHSFHSFLGFTALVQISTWKTDYLVDAIALHDSLNLLGPVFSDPAICKVFHGGDSDSLWLQRDFHLYIVNLFDTAKACIVLGKPQRSFAYLLQSYCGVSTNKVFQRADWRLRPLPEEMVQYARIDAHYLLFISHQLRLELQEHDSGAKRPAITADVASPFHGSFLEQAVHRSNLICLQLYEKEVSPSSSTIATSLLSRFYGTQRCSVQVSDRSLKLIARLYEWRDNMARAEDESLRCVLSDCALVALAVSCPSSHESILSTIAAADALQTSNAPVLSEVPSIPSPVLQYYIGDLCNVLKNADGQNQGRNSKDVIISPLASGFQVWNKIRDIWASGFQVWNKIRDIWAGRMNCDSFVSENFCFETDDGVEKKGSQVLSGQSLKRWKQGSMERSRTQFVKKFSCKAPVYHNCRIYAGDGRLLCFCDRKKLEWYVNRGLAEFVQETPPAIRLLFEPKGRPDDKSNEFYIQSKTNCCVGCGDSSHYLRYRVIPSCYRQHFPEHLKSHHSHDIVLLCVDCHEVAHKAAERYKHQIASEFGVPLFVKVIGFEKPVGGKTEVDGLTNDGEGGVSPLQLKNAAMALLRHGSTIPCQRREELEDVVKSYYGRNQITQEDLHSALLVSMSPSEHRRVSGRKYRRYKGISWSDGGPDTIERTFSAQGAEKRSFSELADAHVAGGIKVNRDALKITNEERPSGSRDESSLKENLSLASNIQHLQRGSKSESILGHGVHGRRVVEMLMKQEGDDGIHQFSQRWRAVFVNAVEPACLPLGWNVLHSGHREFGEYSVYNPNKTKSSIT